MCDQSPGTGPVALKEAKTRLLRRDISDAYIFNEAGINSGLIYYYYESGDVTSGT